jgi:endonuclease/exonuclease/phosphatase family metal-dependent hydrolase
MKITSLNLQGYMGWKSREAAILRYLTKQDSDLIVFQEVVYLPEISPISQVETLNQTLNYPYGHQSITRSQMSPLKTIYREGLAVLSRLPVLNTEALILRQDPADHLQRIIQLVDIQVAGVVVKLANIHFSFPEKLGVAHLEETLSILESRGEERVIIGDFNIPDLEQYRQIWEGKYRASAMTSYISHPSDHTRIDYALIPESDQFDQIKVSPNGLSDHRALTISIEVS